MTKKFLDKFFEPAVAAATSLLDASQHLTILKTKFDGRVSSGSLEVAPSMLMGLAAYTLGA